MHEHGPKLSAGVEAPDFTLQNHEGRSWSLSANRGKVVLLLFYPGNETLVCTKQLCSLRDNWSKYFDTKAEIVGVSVSDQRSNSNFAAKHRLPLPILADPDCEVTARYISHWMFPLNLMRGLTVIDAQGSIRTHQTMLRAFRPNDHDVIRKLYEAKSDAVADRRNELRARVRTMLLR
ncbi:MAG: redoxin domain-containing protein [Pyrinomonadaceae bacterium]